MSTLPNVHGRADGESDFDMAWRHLVKNGDERPAQAFVLRQAEADRKRGERIDALLDQAEAFGAQMEEGGPGGMLGMLAPLLGGFGS